MESLIKSAKINGTQFCAIKNCSGPRPLTHVGQCGHPDPRINWNGDGPDPCAGQKYGQPVSVIYHPDRSRIPGANPVPQHSRSNRASGCWTLPNPPSSYLIVSASEKSGTATSAVARTIPDTAVPIERRIIYPFTAATWRNMYRIKEGDLRFFKFKTSLKVPLTY